MARKAKPKAETITQSALRVTLTMDFPVMEGKQVTDIRKHLSDQDIYTIVGKYYYTNIQAQSKIVQITSTVPTEATPNE